jgi:hypothetical protein
MVGAVIGTLADCLVKKAPRMKLIVQQRAINKILTGNFMSGGKDVQ